MVNRWIASVFAQTLTLIHVIVIVSLCRITYLYLSDDAKFRNLASALLGENVNSFNGFLVVVVVPFVIYVLMVGSLATLIAINQNLERLNEAFKTSATAATTTPAPTQLQPSQPNEQNADGSLSLGQWIRNVKRNHQRNLGR